MLQAEKDAILGKSDDFISFVTDLPVDGGPPPPTTGPLSTLVSNTFRDLGPFANLDPALGQAIVSTESIGDDSGFVYDHDNNQVVGFGGGHGKCNETDLRLFGLETCTNWTSAYQSKSYVSQTFADWDIPNGRWITDTPQGQHPCARHSYNLLVPALGKLYMLAYYAMPYHPYGSPDSALIDYNLHGGGCICWYDWATKKWAYSTIPFASYPWAFYAAAKYDAAAGKMLIAGSSRNYGNMINLFTWDPVADVQAVIKSTSISCGGQPDLIYVPSRDRYYLVQGRTGQVWEIFYNRTNPSASTVTVIATIGAPVGAWPSVSHPNAFGYDEKNNIIGGWVIGGVFNYIDMTTYKWDTKNMVDEAGLGRTPDQKAHCFEAIGDGCFIFNTRCGGEQTPGNVAPIPSCTIAYRFG